MCAADFGTAAQPVFSIHHGRAPFNPIELALIALLPTQRAYSLQVLLNLWLAGLFMALFYVAPDLLAQPL